MSIASAVFAAVLKFGGVGLLVIGILDSSFLIAPWGNDLLVVVMTARHPSTLYMIYYAAMSTVGSVLGCLVIDLTLRPLGAKGLEAHLSPRRLKRVQRKMEQNASLALALASLAPPPFPFTAFVMAAAALQYSRVRLLAVVGATRLLRFAVLGVLALRFGERIMKWGQNRPVQGVMIGLIVFSIVGSAVSVYGWMRRGGSNRGIRSAPVNAR
jgi:membrane protein YqaA with SNARE-associated domain